MLAHLTRDAHAAEDLCQETFAAAWVGIHNFAGDCAITTWLHRIAYRKFLDTRRRRPRIVSVADPDQPVRITAFMKTAVADSGANVCLQFWDAGMKNMLGFASTEVLKGDNDCKAVQSEPVVVPNGAKLTTVRAALADTGKAWFDEIVIREVPRETPRGATTRAASADSLDDELRKHVVGKVVDVLPVEQDQMVLAYLADWAHGRVDNIAVANNDGGVRTLLAWAPVDAKGADRKFLLALYAREFVSKGDAPAPIGARTRCSRSGTSGPRGRNSPRRPRSRWPSIRSRTPRAGAYST